MLVSCIFGSSSLEIQGFPGGSDGKESACHVRDLVLIPGLGRSPGGGHGKPLSVLPGESPWTEEPGKLQSMASQIFGHNWATKHNLETWQVVPCIASISAIMTTSFLSPLYQHRGGWVILAECFVSWLLCICSMVSTLLWVLVIMWLKDFHTLFHSHIWVIYLWYASILVLYILDLSLSFFFLPGIWLVGQWIH